MLRFIDIFGDDKEREEDARNRIYEGKVKVAGYIDDALLEKFGKF